MPSLAPLPKFRFFTAGGLTTPVRPLVGGRVYFYAAGTTTPKDTYTDSTGTTPNTNPVILNARGEASIWLGEGAYKMVVTDAFGVQQGGTVDGIEGSDALREYTDALREDLNDAAGGDFAVALGGISYIVGDGVTNNAAAINAANARGRPILFIGVSNPTSLATITVPILNKFQQIFTPGASVSIGNGRDILIDWFGPDGVTRGNLKRSVNALPIFGGTVRGHPQGTYRTGYDGLDATKVSNGTGVPGVDYLAKNNVTVVGRTPSLKSDNSGFENGTIFLGPLAYHASGLRFKNFGIDVGTATCATYYGSVAQDGLAGVQVNKATPQFYRDVEIEGVVTYNRSPSDFVHGILFEACIGGKLSKCIGYNGYHAVVVKSRDVMVYGCAGVETGAEALIAKSDNYAPMGNVKFVNCDALSFDGSLDPGFGILIDAVTASASGVEILNCRIQSKANGLGLRSNGANILSDVTYGGIVVEGCPIGVLLSGDVRRTRGGEVIANNVTYGLQVEPSVASRSNSLASLAVTNATNSVQLGGKMQIGHLDSENVSGMAVNYYDVGARLVLGTHRETSTAAFWPHQPTFAGSWVNEGTAGNAVMRLTIEGGMIRLTGAIKGGAAATVINGFSTQVRPTENMRFEISGFNGTTLVPLYMEVSTAGVVTIPGYASAPTSIWLNATWPIPV